MLSINLIPLYPFFYGLLLLRDSCFTDNVNHEILNFMSLFLFVGQINIQVVHENWLLC